MLRHEPFRPMTMFVRASKRCSSSADPCRCRRGAASIDTEIPVLAHRPWVPMEHDAAIANRPARPLFALLADEAILDADHVMRKLILVKEMAELLAERVVFVVATLSKPSSTRNAPKLSP